MVQEFSLPQEDDFQSYRRGPIRVILEVAGSLFWGLLGGPWDLVTTYNWAYNPNYNPSKSVHRGYPNYK